MSWIRSVFSRNYKIVIVEGADIESFLNRCLLKKLSISKIKYISATKVRMQINSREYFLLQEVAGNRYNIHVVSEVGFCYRLKTIKNRKAMLAGVLIFAGILFYQSLFIAEIEVSGYEAISEQALRETMEEAGFYEGCRKNVNLEQIKLHIYEAHDKVTWVGIKYKGNLAQVTIAEGQELYKKNVVKDNKPCNIVADKNGYISYVDPEEGMRAVKDGQYVEIGDVLISGTIPLNKTTYDAEEDETQANYVHAAGTVEAKIPVRLTFYEDAYETVKNKTGKKFVTLSINNNEILGGLCPFETSVVKNVNLINWVKPIKIKIQVVLKEEVTVKRQKLTQQELKKEVINEIYKYAEEKLQDNAQILNKSLNFTQEKNIIKVGVTLETLQEIGTEEEITIVDKSNRKSEKNDDQ